MENSINFFFFFWKPSLTHNNMWRNALSFSGWEEPGVAFVKIFHHSQTWQLLNNIKLIERKTFQLPWVINPLPGLKSFLPGNYPLLVSKSQFPVKAQSSILASDINWWTKESNVVGFHNLVDNNKVKLNTLQHHSSCCSQTKLKMFISESSVYFTSSAKSGCWRV